MIETQHSYSIEMLFDNKSDDEIESVLFIFGINVCYMDILHCEIPDFLHYFSSNKKGL